MVKQKSSRMKTCRDLSKTYGQAPAKAEASKKQGMAVHFCSSGVAAWMMMPNPGDVGGTSVDTIKRTDISATKPQNRMYSGLCLLHAQKEAATCNMYWPRALALNAEIP